MFRLAGPLKLSDKQRQQVRDFLARREQRTLDNVALSLTIGAGVPRQIELYDMPTEMSDALHGYNGDKYLLVRDQMIIVDSESRRIVAVIPGVNRYAGP